MYSLEELTGTIVLVRYGVNHYKYGDPYEGAVIVQINEGVGLIKGLTKMPPKSWITALFVELKDKYQLSSIVWERIKKDEAIL